MTTIQTTKTIDNPIYQDAYDIRQEVFVKGQGVPFDLEVDDKEALCLHMVYYLKNKAVATCRLLPLSKDTVILQRMAVLPAYQGQKIGQVLLLEALKIAKQEGYQTMTLHAQINAKGFYDKLGFEDFGELFEEAGIVHVNMRKAL